MNNLFLCKTPYQIMVVVQLVLTKFEKDTNDILIGDTIANANEIIGNLIDSGVFSKVSLHESKKTYSRYTKIDCLRMALREKFGLKNNDVQYNTKYDRFFICNLSLEETIIYRCLWSENKRLKVYLFEDGFATYTKMYGEFFDNLKYKKSLFSCFKTFYKRINYKVFIKLQGIYLFSPELMDWKPQILIEKIDKIDSYREENVKIFNKAFGLDKLIDLYAEDYIFFEESYFADGFDVGDEQILDGISRIVGQQNLFVKIHPRNPVNRFEKKGYKTNKITTIPWEIIALNIDIKNKILLTIASGSALTSLVNVLTKPKKIIMLMDCEEIDKNKLTPSVDMLRKVANNYQNVVLLPKSFLEAKKLLIKE